MNDIFVVSLTNSNQIALIDSEDADKVIPFKWRFNKRDKAIYRSLEVIINGKRFPCILHSFILSRFRFQIDHKNRCRFDNRKSNLRPCNQSQNSQNIPKRDGCSFSYKGVSWSKQKQKWRCRLAINKHETSLGLFDSQEDAALVYNFKAYKNYKEFAVQNTARYFPAIPQEIQSKT